MSLDIVIRSDTEFDVLFALAVTVQKIADRCTFLLSLLGGLSNGGEPHRIWPHIVATLMSFVIALDAH